MLEGYGDKLSYVPVAKCLFQIVSFQASDINLYPICMDPQCKANSRKLNVLSKINGFVKYTCDECKTDQFPERKNFLYF